MSRSGPTARDRIIGAKLRAIRTKRAGIPLERGAELAGWTPARLSRTERGLRCVTTDEVATLLTAWGIPAKDREKVLAEVQSDASTGWWDRTLPGIPAEAGALASYENDAHELINVSTTLVPGLLQTYETAVGAMRADGVRAADIETRWLARRRRQQILGKVDYTAFIGEAALRSPFGGPAALRGQLAHLLAAQDRAVRVRIIPEHQTQVLISHSWLWMGLRSANPVVHVELMPAAFYIHDNDVNPYALALQRLDKVALSQNDSRILITRMLENVQ